MNHRRRDDRGSIAPLIPPLMIALLLLGGLVIDGARDLNARGDAQGYAEEAARAGATGIDTKSALLQLDTSDSDTSARKRVADYCASVMASDPRVTACGLLQGGLDFTDDPDGTVSAACQAVIIEPLIVNTRVTMKIGTTLLGMIGLQELTAVGTGKARPYQGTEQGNQC